MALFRLLSDEPWQRFRSFGSFRLASKSLSIVRADPFPLLTRFSNQRSEVVSKRATPVQIIVAAIVFAKEHRITLCLQHITKPLMIGDLTVEIQSGRLPKQIATAVEGTQQTGESATHVREDSPESNPPGQERTRTSQTETKPCQMFSGVGTRRTPLSVHRRSIRRRQRDWHPIALFNSCEPMESTPWQQSRQTVRNNVNHASEIPCSGLKFRSRWLEEFDASRSDYRE